MSRSQQMVWGLAKTEADYGPSPSPDYQCRNCKYMFPQTGGRHLQAGPWFDQSGIFLQGVHTLRSVI